MVLPFRGFFSSAKRRRDWALAISVLVLVALVGWSLQPRRVRLSPVELALVGEWGHPQIDTPQDYGLAVRPMANPWEVMELTRDGVFRAWFADADDLTHRDLLVEGRWRVVGGGLQIEDIPGGARRLVRDLRAKISLMSDLIPGTQYIRGPSSSAVQFIGTDRLETKWRGSTRAWRRLPTRPVRSPHPPQ